MSNATENDHSQAQLALAKGLTQKTKALCLGLESGAAEILDLVTPTTADLLKWWFGEDMVTARVGLNFHEGQKQAILNTIVAHEVLGADHAHWTLRDLYLATAPDALLIGKRIEEVSSLKHAHPKYCMKMATGTGKTWVLQALMIWQLLNKTHAMPSAIA
jgi:type III restriction enzyme